MKEFEKLLYFESAREVMNPPDISFEKEQGEILLSILLKAYDPDWGGHEHPLSGEVEKYFNQCPLNGKTINFLSDLKVLEDGGVDEEALYNIALTMNKPERIDSAANFISKHKDYIQNFYYLREKFLVILTELEKSLPSELINQFNLAINKDIEMRSQNIEKTKKQISDLIEFYKPNPGTTKINQIVILPTDFLYREKAGTAFEFDKTVIIRSHINNPGNFEHEFLHCIINPIVEKLTQQLTDEQKKKISNYGSYKLKVEEKYGEGHESLLCEEFIRTYNDVIQKGEIPVTFQVFEYKLKELNEESFKIFLEKDKKQGNKLFQLGISTLDDLKNKRKEYWDRFGESKLKIIIYNFYQKYIKERERESNINFEEFVLKEFGKEF